MRTALLEAKPPSWLLYRGWATQDGEHPNVRGTAIENALFTKQLQAWLDGPFADR